jgi:hypothetical protein
MLAFSILRMVIVRIPEDYGWVPAYPTSGTAIEFQFLSPFVIVSFLKVRVRARAQGGVGSESAASVRAAIFSVSLRCHNPRLEPLPFVGAAIGSQRKL